MNLFLLLATCGDKEYLHLIQIEFTARLLFSKTNITEKNYKLIIVLHLGLFHFEFCFGSIIFHFKVLLLLLICYPFTVLHQKNSLVNAVTSKKLHIFYVAKVPKGQIMVSDNYTFCTQYLPMGNLFTVQNSNIFWFT